MDKSADCYFFVDMSLPEDGRGMSVLCVPCHDKDMPETGWFYPGSKEGYGPFDYQCSLCGAYIHKATSEEDDDQEKTQTSG